MYLLQIWRSEVSPGEPLGMAGLAPPEAPGGPSLFLFQLQEQEMGVSLHADQKTAVA